MSMIRRTRFRILRSRVLAVCAALLGASALTVGLTVAPASADILSTISLQDYQTYLCLDSNYSSPSDPAVGAVYTDPCNGGNYQNWNLTTAGPVLQNAQTGLCLDSNYSDPANPAVGAVYTDPCNGGAYQDWYFGGQGPGATLQDGQTGLCLDSNYSNPQYPATGAVYTNPCNWNNTYQNWHVS
jgi:hypothetical protein